MDHEERLLEPLKDVETALRSLAPAGRIDRDRLMFLAGQSSVTRPSRRTAARIVWPAATAASLLTAAVLGALLSLREGPQVVTEIVYVDRPVPTPVGPGADDSSEPDVSFVDHDPDARRRPDRPGSPSPRPQFWSGPHYLALRDTLLAGGVDALPPPSSSGASDGDGATYLRLRDDLLDEPTAAQPGPRSLWQSLFNPGETL